MKSKNSRNINKQNSETVHRAGCDEKAVHCQSCGAVYDRNLPKCPYCGATNPSGAEKAYMDKLHGIRRDMRGLSKVSAEETKRELRETGGVLKKALLIIGLIFLVLLVFVKIADVRRTRAEKEDYLWERETFAVMDAYYEQGDYEAMLKMYYEALQQNRPIYRWEHIDLCELIVIMKEADGLLEQEEPLDEFELQDLLWCELSLKWSACRGISKEDQSWLEDRIAPYLEDLAERFPMTEEEELIFQNGAQKYGGYIEYELCKQYFRDHPVSGGD